jgi:hypothetical protein
VAFVFQAEVISSSALGVAQDLVRLAYLLEPPLCGDVAGIDVWMRALGQSVKGGLNVLRISARGETKNFIDGAHA